MRGEAGWEIIDELAPLPGELIIDKPTKGAFTTTDIDLVLRNRRITHLIFTGITTDVCVHTIMREANDLGYECLVLSDCTGATDYANHLAALQMVKMQGGVFGSVAKSTDLLAALAKVALSEAEKPQKELHELCRDSSSTHSCNAAMWKRRR